MSTNKYVVELTPYEYNILNKNKMISSVCKRQLGSATTVEQDDEEIIELSLTVAELEDLTGFVAAESNHARTERQREDLGEICDYLEGRLYDIKRRSREG